jgi:hypothetical protein
VKQYRVAGVAALLALVAGVISDAAAPRFWARHALLASLVASVIVVLLSVAVIDEVLERRRRRRWKVLAQYVMFELVRNARMTWSGILDIAGMLPTGTVRTDMLTLGAAAVKDTTALTAALNALANDGDRRVDLHSEIALLAEHADDVLARWAAVMLNAEVYAEVINRHVELAGDITWIASLLDSSHPPDDPGRRLRAQNSPALQIEPNRSSDWLADRLVVIAQLAEELDRTTLDLALQIVPVEWWEDRLRTTVDHDGY